MTGDSELLDAVLDAAASLIVVVDADGRLVRWNRACEALLGYSAAELEAPSALFDLIPADERRIAEDGLRALRAGESPVRAEFHWRTRDGDLRLIEWSTTALTGPDGDVTYMVGSGIDVTDSRQLEAERTAAEARLRHMADHDPLTGLVQPAPLRGGAGSPHRARPPLRDGRRAAAARPGRLQAGERQLRPPRRRQGAVGGGRGAEAQAARKRHRARFGGDEFAVLMPVGGVGEATELAELLGAAIRADVPTPAGPLTASVGIALFGDLSTADDMLSRADDAITPQKRSDGEPVRHLRRSSRAAARSLQPCGSGSTSPTRAWPRGARPRTSFATGG